MNATNQNTYTLGFINPYNKFIPNVWMTDVCIASPCRPNNHSFRCKNTSNIPDTPKIAPLAPSAGLIDMAEESKFPVAPATRYAMINRPLPKYRSAIGPTFWRLYIFIAICTKSPCKNTGLIRRYSSLPFMIFWDNLTPHDVYFGKICCAMKLTTFIATSLDVQDCP